MSWQIPNTNRNSETASLAASVEIGGQNSRACEFPTWKKGGPLTPECRVKQVLVFGLGHLGVTSIHLPSPFVIVVDAASLLSLISCPP